MKHVRFSLLVILAHLSIGQAVSQGREVTLDPVQISVDVLPLMAHLEFKVTNNRSFTAGGGVAFSAFVESVDGEENFEAFSIPFVTSSFRNYYSRKRVKKDNLKNNSGNYVGLYFEYQFKTIADDFQGNTIETDLNAYSIGPVWGFQRNYASGIHLDLSLGIGYVGGQSDEFREVNETVTIIGGFEFGFKLNK